MTTRITVVAEPGSHKNVSVRVLFPHEPLPDGTDVSVAEAHILAADESVTITLWGERWLQVEEVLEEEES